jgi:hypothetical protein
MLIGMPIGYWKNMSTNKFLDYSKSYFGDMTIIAINKNIPTA